MKKDQSMLAVLLGLAAGPVFELVTQTLKHLGLTTISALEAISLMWLRKPNVALGLLGALGVSAWVSILIYQSSNMWGTDHFPLKAMLIGMTAESLIFNIFGVLGRNELMVQDVSGNFSHSLAAASAGLLVGFLMKKFLFTEDSHQRK